MAGLVHLPRRVVPALPIRGRPPVKEDWKRLHDFIQKTRPSGKRAEKPTAGWVFEVRGHVYSQQGKKVEIERFPPKKP
jgi:hypothetical protein